MMNGLSQVLALLIGDGEGSNSKEEVLLAASILRSRQCQDSQMRLLVDAVSRDGECVEEMSMLVEGVAVSSDSTLQHYCSQWTDIFIKNMQTATDPAWAQILFRGVSVLLSRVHDSPQVVGDFPSKYLPSLLQSLFGFSIAAPALQAIAMNLLAQVLVQFPSSCSLHRTRLKKWAGSALFNSHQPLSQEGSLVLVLLCSHSNQQWESMLNSALTYFQWIVDQLYQPIRETSKPKFRPAASVQSAISPWLDFQTPPTIDPQRTACLVQQLAQIARTICYALLFPPSKHSLPPSVPLERILESLSQGLREPTAGHTVECLSLMASLPVIHIVMWKILRTLMKTCHAHLLPFSPLISTLLVTAIASGDSHLSPPLLTSVHQALTVWMEVFRDFDPAFMTPLINSLLSSSDHAPLRLSSLQTLCVVVRSVGPLLPQSLASSVLKLSMSQLCPSTPSPEALLLVQLLMECVTSRNKSLCPPMGMAIQLFSELRDHHANRQVVEISRLALLQCSLLMHPSIPQVTIPVTTTGYSPQSLMEVNPHHPIPLMDSPHPTPLPLMDKSYPTPVPLMDKPHPPHPTPVPLMDKPHPTPVPLMDKSHPTPVPLMDNPHPTPVPLMDSPHPPHPTPVPLMDRPHPPPVPLMDPPSHNPIPLMLVHTPPFSSLQDSVEKSCTVPPAPGNQLRGKRKRLNRGRGSYKKQQQEGVVEGGAKEVRVQLDSTDSEASGIELFVADSPDTSD